MAELDASYDALDVVSDGTTYSARSDFDDEPQALKDLALIVDGIAFDVDWKKQQPDCRGWPPPLYE
jgi:hypothetical protein